MTNLKIAFVKFSKDFYEPLNFLSIAAYIKKKFPSIEIKIIDRAYENVTDEINKFNPDIVGLSSMTVEYPLAINLCNLIKKDRDIPVVVGGVHITFLPSSFNRCFDVGVLGEGEIPFSRLVNLFLADKSINKGKLRDLDGFIFYDGEELIINPQKERIEDLDEIPMGDRNLINKNYFSKRPIFVLGKYGTTNSIITSRGCPYNCRFCISTRFFSKLRFHSARRVVDEIKNLYYNYHITHVHICDDLFCCNVPRIKEIISLLEEEGLLGKITYFANVRGNLASDEVFELYKKLGVKATGLGFESGSERIIKYVKGNSISVEQCLDAIKRAIKNGFRMGAAFIIGIPTEKIEDMKKTRDVMSQCIDLGIDTLIFSTLTPYPGSEFWEMAKERGKVSDDMDFSKLSFYDELPLLMDEDVPVEEFLNVRKDIFRILAKLKYRCVKEYFLDSPVRTFFSILSKPYSSLLKLVGLKGEKEEVDEL